MHDTRVHALPHEFEILRHRVEERLASFLSQAEVHARTHAPEAAPIVNQVRELTLRGGKRLRPAVLLAAVECIAPWEHYTHAVIDLSAALELLQTYLLIHDDWIDRDHVRRGGPTVHVALTERYGNPQLGAAAAILAGDIASAMAQELIASPAVPPERVAAILRAYATLQREVVLGQTLDVLGSTNLDSVHDLKTGSYTVRGPLALGHALATGQDHHPHDPVWHALEAFARPLGIAFQLRDDLIGTFGDEKETGKSAGSDLRQGKHTAPVHLALQRLDEPRRKELQSLLGQQDPSAVVRARALIESTGAPHAVEARITQLRQQALTALRSPALRTRGRELLAHLAHTLTERTK